MEDTAEALERLIKMADSLLNLAGNRDIKETEEILLYDLLVRIAEDLKSKAQEKAVDVTVSGNNITVKGTTMLLYRIFYNLIENAVKYNKPAYL